MNLNTRDCEVFAKNVIGNQRFLTREEMIELYLTIKLTKYKDVHPQNFITTKDSVYFIDTESKDFGNNGVDRIHHLLNMVAEEDQQWLKKILQGNDVSVNEKFKTLQSKIVASSNEPLSFCFQEPFVFQTEQILQKS